MVVTSVFTVSVCRPASSSNMSLASMCSSLSAVTGYITKGVGAWLGKG